jgi:Zn-dependent alcohol dehydrogenase
MATQPLSARAIVAHEPKDGKPNLTMESVVPRGLQADELLVKVIATGVCHTDLVFAVYPEPLGGPFPKVLGHEGLSSDPNNIALFLV